MPGTALPGGRQRPAQFHGRGRGQSPVPPEPRGGLADAVNETFGDFAAFKEKVTQNGVTRFGSGWSWLVWNGSALEAYSTANQDSPLMQGHTPLLGVDVWEHAYYLNYQNKRPDYLAAWWNVVNWDAVAARYGTVRS